MSQAYFLGVDVGGTKTHALIADENGQALGFGEAGAGNHEIVGYPGLMVALKQATHEALTGAGLDMRQISGAGFGVAGYDWPSERATTLDAIGCLGLQAPVEAVNDALIGLLAGSAQGWGVAVVSGTGSNARGWDRHRHRQGMVTSGGLSMGEGAGGSELVGKAIQAVAHEWTRRGRPTQLTPALVAHAGAHNAADLIEGIFDRRYHLGAQAAPLVFKAAEQGDAVALDLIHWAGRELGELAKCVIRQLDFYDLVFDVVQVGSMFSGSPLLGETMRETIQPFASGARMVRLTAPPVVGAVVLGMEQVGLQPSASQRHTLTESAAQMRARLIVT